MNPIDNAAESLRERSAPMRVLVASGDSVGHLSHAAVLLDALGQRHVMDAAVVLPRNARFRGWIEGRGYPVVPVGAGLGTHRECSTMDLFRHAPALAWSTLRGIREGVAEIDRFGPDVVIGTGGRCSFAPMLAAVLRGLPTVTVPHYAVRRANRLLAQVVDRTCLARGVDVEVFPGHVRPRLRVTGTPLRPEAFLPACRVAACRGLGLDPERLVVGHGWLQRRIAEHDSIVCGGGPADPAAGGIRMPNIVRDEVLPCSRTYWIPQVVGGSRQRGDAAGRSYA